MKCFRERAGFTLLEVLIACAVGGLLLGMAFQFFAGFSSKVISLNVKSSVDEQVIGLLKMVKADVDSRYAPEAGETALPFEKVDIGCACPGLLIRRRNKATQYQGALEVIRYQTVCLAPSPAPVSSPLPSPTAGTLGGNVERAVLAPLPSTNSFPSGPGLVSMTLCFDFIPDATNPSEIVANVVATFSGAAVGNTVLRSQAIPLNSLSSGLELLAK